MFGVDILFRHKHKETKESLIAYLRLDNSKDLEKNIQSGMYDDSLFADIQATGKQYARKILTS